MEPNGNMQALSKGQLEPTNFSAPLLSYIVTFEKGFL